MTKTIAVCVSTGKIHWGLGPNATACNSSGKSSIRNRPATYELIKYQIGRGNICKKCFPKGIELTEIEV